MSGNNNASGNPGNFANRPTEEVKAIASKGGHASGGNHSNDETVAANTPGGSEGVSAAGRNPDGTFAKGSEAAKKAGQKGGSH